MSSNPFNPQSNQSGASSGVHKDTDNLIIKQRYQEIEDAIKKVWQSRDDNAVAQMCVQIFRDGVTHNPDLLMEYGPGLWADVCCRIGAFCNFWLDVKKQRLEVIKFIEERWSEEGERFSRLQQILVESLDAYPWNPKWLVDPYDSTEKAFNDFTTVLLETGLSNFIAEGNDDVDEDELNAFYTFSFGSKDNARILVLEAFMRGMNFQKALQERILDEEGDQSEILVPDDTTSTEDVINTAEWLSAPLDSTHHNMSPALNKGNQCPWLLKGKQQASLLEALKALPLSALIVTAKRHGLDIAPEAVQSKDELADVVAQTLKQQFLNDLMFLGESELSFLLELAKLNGMLMSMNDAFHFVGLIMDGYIFAYARHGGMRFYLPSELAILLSHFDYKEYERQYIANRRLSILMTVMSNLYGVFKIPDLVTAARVFCSEDLQGMTSQAIRYRIRQAVEILGRHATDYNYNQPFIYHTDLTKEHAEKIWQAAEQHDVNYRPITPEIVEAYATRFFDPNNRHYIKLNNLVKQAFKDESDENMSSTEVEMVLRLLTWSIVSGDNAEEVLSTMPFIPKDYYEDILAALLDFSNTTSHWEIRGHTPSDLGIDLSRRIQ